MRLKDKILNQDNLEEAARLSIQDQRKVTEDHLLKPGEGTRTMCSCGKQFMTSNEASQR